MKYPKHAKRKLFTSFLCILLCISMLLGSTYAWFTDRVSTKNNIITSGNLDLEMYWTDDPSTGVWNNVEEDAFNTIFSYDNWEPGYTDVKYIKLVNKGDLALNYDLSIEAQGAVGKLAEVINVYFAVNEDKLNLRSDLDRLSCIGLLSNVMNGGSQASGTLLPEGTTSLFHNSGEVIVTLAMQMITSAGNEYQNESSGEFTIKALATQAPWERDSFGSDYDSQAEMPITLVATNITVPVTAENDAIPAGGLEIVGPNAAAYLPEGVQLESGVTELTFSITPKEGSDSGLSTVNDEILIPVDVHIEGVSESNTVPIIIDLGAIMPKYLNMGNYKLVHVEDGTSQIMTQVSSRDQLQNHNEFTYDSATGAVSVCMATFSEVAYIADLKNAWHGGLDYNWFTTWREDPTDTNKVRRIYTIHNADQLYGFAKLQGQMHTQDEEWLELEIAFSSNDDTVHKNTVLVDNWGRNIVRWGFDGHTIELVNDIDLNSGNIPMGEGKTRVFYPIGYYNNTETLLKDKNAPEPVIYDRTDGTVVGLQGVSSSVRGFRGTFHGNGHTISNFYQNTWDMFGDYNDGYSGTPNYYKDAMGLFGYLYGAEVRNLTVDRFSCDGEFTPAGVLAAYAAAAADCAENGDTPEPGKGYDQGATTIASISITNCNPRVYNTGNGGVIGIGGNDDDRYDGNNGGSATNLNDGKTKTENCRIVFDGVTVDNSNKISALWGSWDVACGGIMGMFRGRSRVVLNNCSVSAQIDVYNDVCGNYQYYWYRYAGMMIGSLRRRNTTDAQGYTVPDMDNIAAFNSTVHFGEWNNYYYCELVANSLASYTHDHQMSRLVEIDEAPNTTNMTVQVNGKTVAIPTSGRANYVVVEKLPHATENATCYHFVDGAVWNHEQGGYEEKDIDGDGKIDSDVLKEDKQHIYLPFNQLFQGDGWGVKHIPIYDDGKNYYDGITILDRTDYLSHVKFAPKYETSVSAPLTVAKDEVVTAGDLFAIVEGENVKRNRVVITMEDIGDPTDEKDNVNLSSLVLNLDYNKTEHAKKNWTDRTITFGESGLMQIVIQDYEYCKPTYLYINVVEASDPVVTCEHCGKTEADINWQPFAPGALAAGHYYLVGDAAPNQAINVSGDLVIHLNGHNMKFPASEAFIASGNGNTLSIMGTGSVDGYGSSETGVIHITEGADLNLYGGTYGYVDVAEDADAVPAAAVLYAAETGTTVRMKDTVTVVDGEVLLTADSRMILDGRFTASNFSEGIELQNYALLSVNDTLSLESRGIPVIPSGVFTTGVSADKQNQMKACFTVPTGYTAIRVEGGALHSDIDRLATIQAEIAKGADIQAKNSWSANELTTCPMCGATNVTWEVLNLSKGESAGKYVGSGSAHVLLKDQGTKNAPAKVNNIIYAAAKDITMCVLVKGENYVTGRFLIRPDNVMNVMGDGFVTSNGTHLDGTWGELGLFTMTGPDVELNLYGGTYEYTGGYRRLQSDGFRIENPEYALINTTDRKSLINIYQGVVIGGETSRDGENYLVSTYGTMNMYGGIIRNGTSTTNAAGGNVTVQRNGVLNMYGGTITGGKTAFQGGNILLKNYSSMNMGYPGLDCEPVVENGQSIWDDSFYADVTVNEYGDKAVTNGGGNIGTPNVSAYVTFTMHDGIVRNGTVVPEKSGYHEYQGGGNLYLYGRNGIVANLNSGLITDGKACSGGNIFARNGAVINIKDGMTISNGKGYYYKEVDGVEQLVAGAAASQTHGGNIDLFNYAQLNMYGGIVTDGEAYRGGNINVGHGALTQKPVANIMGGEITNGTSGFGGNFLVWSGDLNISGGTISGGVGPVHPTGSNIVVSGSVSDTQLADTEAINSGKYTATLNISGGNIQGGIKVFQYVNGEKWYPTPAVILSGAPTIGVDANNYGLHLCYRTETATQLLADVSGLTGGSIAIQMSSGHYGVFTLETANAETVKSYLVSAVAGYSVVAQGNALALVANS